ncbi:hypothetical protein CBS101457_005614 [Exobasidium rhododendri]|nr:hypothetical protein CBS101457_005614 [Exobasidium rhododendri]
MASGTMAASQFTWRSQKAIGIYSGPPEYTSQANQLDEGLLNSTARTFQYSLDGSLLACAFDSVCLLIKAQPASSESSSSSSTNDFQCQALHSLPVEKVVDLQFSPKGKFISTWQRPSKDAEGNSERNLNIWNTQTGEKVGSFERKSQEGCHFHFVQSEKACLRLVTNELQVFDPQDMNGKGVIGRLRLEGMTSYEVGPGEKPSVAVFCGEKKGAPASVRIYPLSALIPTPDEAPRPISQKTFFKADKIQIKWNTAGTGLLFATSTDVDKTGKSYYGETNLYMMSTRGDFDCRVALDKEGPVHDFEWNPNGREFLVVYGYMPAKSTLFSYRINVIAELGTSSRNFAAFNPSGRFFALAGFGNLSGTVDVWDREKLGTKGSSVEANAKGKSFSFDASNSSLFQWSPDGQFILTATLSPRLRVDNGVRVWHCTGNLVHVEMINDLYQASWRPMLADVALAKYPFPATIPESPAPSAAAQSALEATKAKAEKKAMGAYRPPGARGAPASDVFSKRSEDTTPLASNGNSGTYLPPGAARNKQAGGGRKSVPGAAPPAATTGPKNGSAAVSATNGKGGRKGNNSNTNTNNNSGSSTPTAARTNYAEDIQTSTPTNMVAEVGGDSATDKNNGAQEALAGGVGAIDKKVRNLTKKLKAIQELKEKRDNGEKLEQTQIKKIDNEASLKKELAELE